MEEEQKVKLYAVWASTYVKRVEFALRAKGILYEFVEEDLSNKSKELLQYNPVHKMVPVLVHNGKPIAETSIILEYIDETWKQPPRLLPDGAYQRAKVRFWADLVEKLFGLIKQAVMNDGERQERAIRELLEKMSIFDEEMKKVFPNGVSAIEVQNLGLLDIVVGGILGCHKTQEEIIGVKILGPERNPVIFSWVTALKQLPILEEVLPPHEKLLGFLQWVRKTALESSG